MRFLNLSCSLVLALFALGCGGNGSISSGTDLTGSGGNNGPVAALISVAPAVARVPIGQTTQFEVEYSNGTYTEVRMAIQESGGGEILSATNGFNSQGKPALKVTYRAPYTPGLYHLVAIPTANPNDAVTVTASVIQGNVTVTIDPPMFSAPPATTQGFTATVGVTEGMPNPTLTWSIRANTAGDPAGTFQVDPQDPKKVTVTTSPKLGTYFLRATPDSDPGSYAEATITVTTSDGQVPLSLAPSQITIRTGETVRFVVLDGAGVSWTSNSSDAPISTAGVLRPKAPGIYLVTASTGTRTGTAIVEVVAESLLPTWYSGTVNLAAPGDGVKAVYLPPSGMASAPVLNACTGEVVSGGSSADVRRPYLATFGLSSLQVLSLDKLVNEATIPFPIQARGRAHGLLALDLTNPTGRERAILVTGGTLDQIGAPATQKAHLVYPERKFAVEETGGLLMARAEHTLTPLPDGRALVVGGLDPMGASPVPTVEIFDPASRQFNLVGTLSTPRFGHTATLLADGRVLIAGGYTSVLGAVTGNTEIWTPIGSRNGSLSNGPTLVSPRANHVAVAIASTKTLIVGGTGSGSGSLLDATNSLTSLEVIDSSGNGSVTTVGDLVTGRAGAQAVMIADGSVMIAGGMQGLRYLTSVEQWKNNTITPAGRLNHPRAYGTSIRYPDDNLTTKDGMLVVGGEDGEGLQDLEYLTPLPNYAAGYQILSVVPAVTNATVGSQLNVAIKLAPSQGAGGNPNGFVLRSAAATTSTLLFQSGPKNAGTFSPTSIQIPVIPAGSTATVTATFTPGGAMLGQACIGGQVQPGGQFVTAPVTVKPYVKMTVGNFQSILSQIDITGAPVYISSDTVYLKTAEAWTLNLAVDTIGGTTDLKAIVASNTKFLSQVLVTKLNSISNNGSLLTTTYKVVLQARSGPIDYANRTDSLIISTADSEGSVTIPLKEVYPVTLAMDPPDGTVLLLDHSYAGTMKDLHVEAVVTVGDSRATPGSSLNDTFWVPLIQGDTKRTYLGRSMEDPRVSGWTTVTWRVE